MPEQVGLQWTKTTIAILLAFQLLSGFFFSKVSFLSLYSQVNWGVFDAKADLLLPGVEGVFRYKSTLPDGHQVWSFASTSPSCPPCSSCQRPPALQDGCWSDRENQEGGEQKAGRQRCGGREDFPCELQVQRGLGRVNRLWGECDKQVWFAI